MKIGLVQWDILSAQPDANVAQVTQMTDALDVHLLILPELCTSGYLLSKDQLRALAITIPGPGLESFIALAKARSACVIAGVVERDGAHLYNTAIIVSPQGFIGAQRKIHLTRLERATFTQGTTSEVFTVGDLRFGIVTCFDAWFPELSRALCVQGAQLLCQPAAFGGPQTLDIMRVRAMENHVFVATANRTGQEMLDGMTATFRGESRLVGCHGELIVTASQEPAVVAGEFDPKLASSKTNVMCDDLCQEWSRYMS